MKTKYIKPEIEIIKVQWRRNFLMSHSEVEVTENIGANNYFFDTDEEDNNNNTTIFE